METQFTTIAQPGTQFLGAHPPMHPMATATLTQIAEIHGDLAMLRHCRWTAAKLWCATAGAQSICGT
ncbi:hypothetical protein TP47_03800 [Xanthomonas citri pv. aurantifolii]|nr:hypothetical protein TP37_01715 [Xanthomonas citri pv. aurantifolii]AMV01328.1 hypothetical protein TP50_01725 [Xanthomonas citri pv. aurantifolii]AMV06403.1 hypothetical protein AC028_05800 [Xanthomonas citri pv. aurantifolii]ARE58520.1 hypothetical protein TP45_20820 [Xanthomonas citri pv. aurantifolii]TBW95403.1 hypothetical protein TP49_15900 [Xanthomonas citri pv. aurantifolii]